ncbi:MAG: Xaa-Pro peptidase family protein [Actinomycetota bacterium]|nr:Xaa-Pro peptidase family protein [Actinomycetota bacterium]
MTTFLLLDDSLRSHEMRHEIGEAIVDPLIFIEHDGKRIVAGSDLEASIFETREDVVDEFWNVHDLGVEELIKQESFPYELIDAELALRALEKLGVRSVNVPPTFQVKIADYLRDKEVEVEVDSATWIERRRRKAPWEIEGIERAQRAAETAMLTAARMLYEAEPTAQGQLRYEGEILTAELIRFAMERELLAQGAESSDIIVHSGDACLRGHEMGTGPVLLDQSCIIDCFPRDRRTGVYSDMTRTFVPGTPSEELSRLHAACRKALDIAFDAIKPGSQDAFKAVADYFDAEGFPTQLTHSGPGPLREGFSHSLGHGVGLEVHERPYLGRRPDELKVGDVVAVEPGLYFEGIGGVRLEDTVLVGESGIEHFTEPFSYELTPLQ